ncbi:preprotein translocase subunit YajC [Metasolibacillus meyeri]|uniref:Preprotein translocase subunit YajC n=1 Tax=Metasolibacillus meyeri TaxID=1071052 RepID=A0AAW9NPR3_9BACL|nr:preprotein translocase subunit YajC [Metasolibacillus meyeri]MEC1178317.1 preprotein translocase subunit YajC [Metasolibacillus meyeri]
MESLYSFLPIIIMFVAMWFILIRPAQKRQKATAEMQNNIKRGDRVVTIGGLHGEVDAIEDAFIYVIIGDNVRVKFERQAIGRVLVD